MSGRVAAHGTGSGGGDGLGRGLREEPAFAAELHAGLERDQRPETALPDRGRSEQVSGPGPRPAAKHAAGPMVGRAPGRLSGRV